MEVSAYSALALKIVYTIKRKLPQSPKSLQASLELSILTMSGWVGYSTARNLCLFAAKVQDVAKFNDEMLKIGNFFHVHTSGFPLQRST